MSARVRSMYVHATGWNFTDEPTPQQESLRETNATEFDRFIAEVKAKAWDEGLEAGRDRWAGNLEVGYPPVNPYKGGDR